MGEVPLWGSGFRVHGSSFRVEGVWFKFPLLLDLTEVPRLLRDVPLSTSVSVGSAVCSTKILNGSREAKGIRV